MASNRRQYTAEFKAKRLTNWSTGGVDERNKTVRNTQNSGMASLFASQIKRRSSSVLMNNPWQRSSKT